MHGSAAFATLEIETMTPLRESERRVWPRSLCGWESGGSQQSHSDRADGRGRCPLNGVSKPGSLSSVFLSYLHIHTLKQAPNGGGGVEPDVMCNAQSVTAGVEVCRVSWGNTD